MDQQLVALLQNTATTYARMLKKFRPCKPGDEFLEQNLLHGESDKVSSLAFILMLALRPVYGRHKVYTPL